MVKKFVTYTYVVASFMLLLLACSGPSPKEESGGFIHIDSKWGELPKGESFPWDNLDGFYPHKYHPYGFDRHTKPVRGKEEDSIVHASIATRSIIVNIDGENTEVETNKDGVATLKIVKFMDSPSEYEHYICDPAYPSVSMEVIDDTKTEQIYEFTNDIDHKVKKIALCRRDKNNGVKIMQELHIHTYDWKEYDFLPAYYSDGGTRNEKNSLVASYEFWDGFVEVYKQAMVSPSISKVMTVESGSTIATQVRGEYSGCPEGGINATRDNIIKKIKSNDLPNRVILQLGLPTQQYWPLKIEKSKEDNSSETIEICGNPIIYPLKDRDYDIIPVKDTCNYYDMNIRWNSEDDKLYVISKNGGEPILATSDYFPNISCIGMAEPFPYSLGNQYIGEFNENTLARTWILPDENISIVALPWHGEDTKLIAYHELGHAMGLGDVRTNLLNVDEEQPESEEGNLMFYKIQKGFKKGYKLRFHDTGIADTTKGYGVQLPPLGNENQWSCLRRESPEKTCVIQKWAF